MIVFLPAGSPTPRRFDSFDLVAPRTRSLGELHAFVRDEQRLDRMTLAGIGEGAALACDFSLRFPGLAERLVLVDPPVPSGVVPTEALLVTSQEVPDERLVRVFPNRIGPLRDALAQGSSIRHLCRDVPARASDELAFVSLGSNLGDRERHLGAAFAALRALRGVRDVVASRIYETDPVGPGRQEPYLNAVARLATELTPRALLEALLEIELRAGRARSDVRNEPRTLDLDLLVYGHRVIAEPDLAVPHPRIAERPFVLEPLCDLAPDLVTPGARAPVSALAAWARDPAAVRVRDA